MFVLDEVDNPHPRMLERALNLRRIARSAPSEPLVFLPWQGYLDCMCDATGETPEAINAWLDSHDPLPNPLVTHREPTATSTPAPVELVRKQ